MASNEWTWLDFIMQSIPVLFWIIALLIIFPMMIFDSIKFGKRHGYFKYKMKKYDGISPFFILCFAVFGFIFILNDFMDQNHFLSYIENVKIFFTH